MVTNKNYNIDVAKFADKKVMLDFAKQMCFDERTPGLFENLEIQSSVENFTSVHKMIAFLHEDACSSSKK